MFQNILESGDQINNIGDKFKTIRSSQIITWGLFCSSYSFSDMKKESFWIQKPILKYS